MSVLRVIIPAVVIIAIGGAIGLADMARRQGKVSLTLPEPPPLPPPKPAKPSPNTTPTDQPDPAPVQPTEPADGTPTPLTPPSADNSPAPAAQTPPADLPKGHISIDQAWSLFEQQAFFVDARRKDVYVEGHVQGALRADMASFKTSNPQWVSGLPKDMIIVVYCNGGDCDESEHVAQLLYASGFTAVYIMHDGFPGWKAAGHPVDTGEGQE